MAGDDATVGSGGSAEKDVDSKKGFSEIISSTCTPASASEVERGGIVVAVAVSRRKESEDELEGEGGEGEEGVTMIGFDGLLREGEGSSPFVDVNVEGTL